MPSQKRLSRFLYMTQQANDAKPLPNPQHVTKKVNTMASKLGLTCNKASLQGADTMTTSTSSSQQPHDLAYLIINVRNGNGKHG